MPRKPTTAPNHAPNKKIFIPDTSALIHDPNCLFAFDEHDVCIPIIVLEELDRNKAGHSEKSRSARQAVRNISAIINGHGGSNLQWMPLKTPGNLQSTGRLSLLTKDVRAFVPEAIDAGIPDNQIIGAAFLVRKDNPKSRVIIVSNDVALRVKAIACGILAEEYAHDRSIDDISLLPSGIRTLPEDFWAKQSNTLESWKEPGDKSHSEIYRYRIRGDIVPTLRLNEFIHFEDEGEHLFLARIDGLFEGTAILTALKDFSRHETWGVRARNIEQICALDALLNPEIDLVSILGQAGSGKTLLALAAGLSQTYDTKRYRKIIMTRLTVPIGEDIGFLPGTEEEKMTPWMGALMDNMEILCPSSLTRVKRRARKWEWPCCNAPVSTTAHRNTIPELHARTHAERAIPHR